MLESLREETEGKLQMLLSLRKKGLASLFKEVRVLKGEGGSSEVFRGFQQKKESENELPGPLNPGSQEVENGVEIGRTPRGLCNRTLLRRVLRRFFTSSCFLEGFLEGTCEGCQYRDMVLRRVLRRGGFYRRRLEGRNTALRRVRPPLRAPYEKELK